MEAETMSDFNERKHRSERRSSGFILVLGREADLPVAWFPTTVLHNGELCWQTCSVCIGAHSYRHDPVRRSNYRHGLCPFVSSHRTLVLPDIGTEINETSSLAARFGRKWGMYLLWSFLALSVTLEVVARRWEVWVCHSNLPLSDPKLESRH